MKDTLGCPFSLGAPLSDQPISTFSLKGIIMKNFVQVGLNISVTAAALAASGAGVLIGNLFGIATGAAEAGEVVTLVRTGVFELPKLSTDVFAAGDAVYWDDTAKECTATSASNTLIGCAVQAAANPTATAIILLDGVIRV
jgi:predicted RecA/RadA family phage recombinase